MLFNSYAFIGVFLPLVLILFYFFRKLPKIALALLMFASLAFYSYWDIRFLPILLVSIAFNFSIGRLIINNRELAKIFLLVGVAGDLLLLGYFKYMNFFISNYNDIFQGAVSPFDLILPLGISFFTFTQIAFIVDAYRGEIEEFDLLTYSLFVTFFPHLIAGPILYHKNIIPQFYDAKTFAVSHENIARGLCYFIIGLFKKVVIADSISPWVKIVFDNPASATFTDAWIGALSYTFQLYFDFSGYSDMAIGLGLMLNIRLPINFNSPYKALSIREFWKRWHITLSEFLKNYLYIPLGGNRGHHIRNILITMLLGGLWHGAGWTFVVWGGLHGLYISVNHIWSRLDISLPKTLCWMITFISVVVAWVFFRASSLTDGLNIVGNMFGFGADHVPMISGVKLRIELTWLLLLLIGISLPNTQQVVEKIRPNLKFAVAAAILFWFCLLRLNNVSEFLYFQF